jgi:hypothetical protein
MNGSSAVNGGTRPALPGGGIAAGGETMTTTEPIRRNVALIVREQVVDEIDDVIHGATFDGRRLVLAAGNRLARLMPDSGRVFDQLETFPARGGLAYDGRNLWQISERHIQQLDPRTGLVLRSVSPELREVTGLECLGPDLLVLHAAGRALARVETLNATAVANIEMKGPLRGLAWVAGELWSSTAAELCCIDPASGRITAQFGLPAGIEVCDLAGDTEGRFWCVDGRTRVLRALVRSHPE